MQVQLHNLEDSQPKVPVQRPSRLQLLDAIAAMDLPFVHHTIAGRSVVFINEPTLIHSVLVTQASSFEKSEFQERVMGIAEGSNTGLGNGMLTSSNATNKQQRKLLGRVFSNARMQHYAQQMAELSWQEFDSWPSGHNIEAGAAFMRLSTRVIAKTLFSWDLPPTDEVLFRTLCFVGRTLGRPAKKREQGWVDPSLIEQAGATIESRIMNLVHHRRQHRQAEIATMDVVDLLLSANEQETTQTTNVDVQAYPMTDQQIRDDLMTLFITGAENPRNALTWTIYLLLRHPLAMQKLHAEANAAGIKRGHFTPETLERLPFALQVFKEALRLYPPGYAFGRRAMEDVTIGPLEIPRGAEIVVSPYALHRRPSLYGEPQKFLPERFAPGHAANIPTYAFLPFGVGPRSCIGGGLALLQGQIALGILFSELRISSLSDKIIEPDPRMTLRPGADVTFVVHRDACGGHDGN